MDWNALLATTLAGVLAVVGGMMVVGAQHRRGNMTHLHTEVVPRLRRANDRSKQGDLIREAESYAVLAGRQYPDLVAKIKEEHSKGGDSFRKEPLDVLSDALAQDLSKPLWRTSTLT